MPRARFKFEMDKKVTIDTRRNLHRLASQHYRDTAVYADILHRSIRAALASARQLAHAERRSIEADMFAGDDLIAATNETTEHEELLQALDKLVRTSRTIRKTKIDAATNFEETYDPFFRDPKNPVKLHNQPKTPEPAGLNLIGDASPVVPDGTPAPGTTGPILTLPEELIAEAAREIEKKQEETGENQLSEPSTGN